MLYQADLAQHLRPIGQFTTVRVNNLEESGSDDHPENCLNHLSYSIH
jgi:hypothetical protein